MLSEVKPGLFVLDRGDWGRPYSLFLDVRGGGGVVEVYGSLDGVWLDSVVVPGWVRRGLDADFS